MTKHVTLPPSDEAKKAPTYFYRVTIVIKAFNEKIFSHQEDFKDPNLLMAKQEAFSYYNRLEDSFLNRGTWHHGAVKIQLLFYEVDEKGKFDKNTLAGAGIDTCVEGLQYECSVLYQLYGYVPPL